jgi:hypothetical protein
LPSAGLNYAFENNQKHVKMDFLNAEKLECTWTKAGSYSLNRCGSWQQINQASLHFPLSLGNDSLG